MPCLGDDRTALSEATFESGVLRILDRFGTRRNWTLVGHSFGGFAATEAALRASGRVRSIVYIAGWVPRAGDDWKSVAAMAPATDGFRVCSRKNADETAIELDARAATPFLWHDVAPGIAAAAASRIRPQPTEPFESAKIGGTDALLAKIPRSLLLATADRVLPPDGLRAVATRAGVPVEELPTGHCPFLSAPKRVADALLGVR